MSDDTERLKAAVRVAVRDDAISSRQGDDLLMALDERETYRTALKQMAVWLNAASQLGALVSKALGEKTN